MTTVDTNGFPYRRGDFVRACGKAYFVQRKTSGTIHLGYMDNDWYVSALCKGVVFGYIHNCWRTQGTMNAGRLCPACVEKVRDAKT